MRELANFYMMGANLLADNMFDQIFFYAHHTQFGFIHDHIALFPPFFNDDDAALFQIYFKMIPLLIREPAVGIAFT